MALGKYKDPKSRTLLTAMHVAEEVCAPVAHRQVVLTIPKRLRLHTRFERSLLGKLCSCAAACIQAEVRRLLGREDFNNGCVSAAFLRERRGLGSPHTEAEDLAIGP